MRSDYHRKHSVDIYFGQDLVKNLGGREPPKHRYFQGGSWYDARGFFDDSYRQIEFDN
jgi:hypothetical protein